MEPQLPRHRDSAVAPEGDHFEFDDDGVRLRLVVFSRRGSWRRLAVGIVTLVLLGVAIRFLQFGGFAQVFLAVFALLILWATIQAWLGFESTEITSTEVQVRRYLFPFSRLRSLARDDCSGIGLVPERPISEHDDLPADPEIIGTAKGRLAFVSGTGALLDFGDVLTEHEARLVQRFLCEKMPDIKEVAIKVSDVYRA